MESVTLASTSLERHEIQTVPGFKQVLIAGWGVAGVAAILGRAVVALTPTALETILAGTLSRGHWVVLVAWVAMMAYSEGYRGFHLRFSPRVVHRAHELGRRPSLIRLVLAAPFCIGFFSASRRILLTSWGVTLGVTVLVLLVRQLDQPWRGIVDAGVVVGLALGLLSLFVHFAVSLRGTDTRHGYRPKA